MMDFIGKGVVFPPEPGTLGETITVVEELRIISNVKFLLSVRKGTIPGLESIGSELPDLPFSRLTGDLEYIKQSLLELFRTYEKRIIVTDIPIKLNSEGKGINIKVKFKIRSFQSEEFTVET